MEKLKNANMNLQGMKTYLSGPIQYANDNGTTWRQRITPKLISMGIDVIDPCDKKDFTSEIGDFRNQMRLWRETGDFEKIRANMKIIRRWDLRAVDYSNFIIVNVDKDIPTWGTVDECVVAERQKKPILIMCKDGLAGCPDWLFAIAKLHEIFTTEDEVIEHLRHINEHGFENDLRWLKI